MQQLTINSNKLFTFSTFQKSKHIWKYEKRTQTRFFVVATSEPPQRLRADGDRRRIGGQTGRSEPAAAENLCEVPGSTTAAQFIPANHESSRCRSRTENRTNCFLLLLYQITSSSMGRETASRVVWYGMSEYTDEIHESAAFSFNFFYPHKFLFYKKFQNKI
jgi:hypothetical protein